MGGDSEGVEIGAVLEGLNAGARAIQGRLRDRIRLKRLPVLKFMRDEYFEKGTGPTVRVLGKTSGVSVKELYQLFPKGPAKIAARVSGIPKPRGCI